MMTAIDECFDESHKGKSLPHYYAAIVWLRYLTSGASAQHACCKNMDKDIPDSTQMIPMIFNMPTCPGKGRPDDWSNPQWTRSPCVHPTQSRNPILASCVVVAPLSLVTAS
jgi:hypothetical protein